jgi:hypothetical protein
MASTRPLRLLLGLLGAGVISACLVGCADDGAARSDEDTAGAEDALTAFEPPPAYAEGKLLSDLTPEVVAKLREVHSKSAGQDNSVFIKVGDSITVSTSFLTCFSRTPVSATEGAARLEETRRFFSENAWSRATKAARVGAHTNEALSGNPSPLAREVGEMRPAFAVVMLGTNDVFEGTQPSYERNLGRLVTAIADQGIVPILSTIPPMKDAARNLVIVKMNRIVRKIAAEAKIPLMDFHLAVIDLPKHGLSSDGVHPFQASTGACDFRPAAMNAGYNQRNLLALKALDRTRRAVLDAVSEGTAAEPPLTAEGDGDTDTKP